MASFPPFMAFVYIEKVSFQISKNTYYILDIQCPLSFNFQNLIICNNEGFFTLAKYTQLVSPSWCSRQPSKRQTLSFWGLRTDGAILIVFFPLLCPYSYFATNLLTPDFFFFFNTSKMCLLPILLLLSVAVYLTLEYS